MSKKYNYFRKKIDSYDVGLFGHKRDVPTQIDVLKKISINLQLNFKNGNLKKSERDDLLFLISKKRLLITKKIKNR